jgi:hypothetical protein
MIWKSIILSFFLNYKNNNIIQNKHNTKAPLRAEKTYGSVFIPTIVLSTNLGNILKNKKKNIHDDIYSGYDERYNISETDYLNSINMIYNISLCLYKKKLLEKLENKNISQVKKIEEIQKPKWLYLTNKSKYLPNITSGGLFNDWNLTF